MVAVAVIAVVVAAAVAIFQWQAKVKRREDLFALANRLGLAFSQRDPLGTVGLPFPLFERGDGRGVENVLWGTVAGKDIRLFDYWYYDESTDSKGNKSRTYHRFSCALGPIPAACPALSISREGFFSRVADHIGMRDIEFESEEFNRAFEVRGDDRRFAYALVDARMMAWLLTHEIADRFEIAGNRVLCATRKLPVAATPNLLVALDGFCDHVPAVITDLFPLRDGPTP